MEQASSQVQNLLEVECNERRGRHEHHDPLRARVEIPQRHVATVVHVRSSEHAQAWDHHSRQEVTAELLKSSDGGFAGGEGTFHPQLEDARLNRSEYSSKKQQTDQRGVHFDLGDHSKQGQRNCCHREAHLQRRLVVPLLVDVVADDLASNKRTHDESSADDPDLCLGKVCNSEKLAQQRAHSIQDALRQREYHNGVPEAAVPECIRPLTPVVLVVKLHVGHERLRSTRSGERPEEEECHHPEAHRDQRHVQVPGWDFGLREHDERGGEVNKCSAHSIRVDGDTSGRGAQRRRKPVRRQQRGRIHHERHRQRRQHLAQQRHVHFTLRSEEARDVAQRRAQSLQEAAEQNSVAQPPLVHDPRPDEGARDVRDEVDGDQLLRVQLHTRQLVTAR
ncbi:hypothetical protein ON010_g4884 [Phytophthora cinnamomi]|nr:hypothetical protein ON010_g4884 [Phytophthora cinnamomi]